MKLLALVRSDAALRRNLILFLIAYFCVLLNYPLIRAASTTFFFEGFGAKSSPTAWLWAVLLLTGTIFVSNKLQIKYTVQKVFFIVSALSFLVFAVGTLGFDQGLSSFTFLPFIWKEIYIVLQVHLLLAYANCYFKREDFKLLVGPVGAVGSLGGFAGGWLTSYLAPIVGTSMVMWLGLGLLMLPTIFFFGTQALKKELETKSESPLASLTPDIKRYVALIAAIVALSQFIISIADFNFHLSFEQAVLSSTARTAYLGDIYMYTNFVTFLLQFLVLPLVIVRVSEKIYHLFIPLSYMLSLLVLTWANMPGALPLAVFFIYLKASDYSLFSAGKEILYQPLSVNQKYGAKYLTDMLVYRMAKALIAAVLIYLQTSTILNTLVVLFLLIWIIMIIKLFKLQRQLFT